MIFKNRWFILLIVIGLVSVGVRVLMDYNFQKSALLYILGPFLVSLALASKHTFQAGATVNARYSKLVVDSLVVMLGSSIVLFEGFLCVLMFMPLYFFIVLISFMIERLKENKAKDGKSTLYLNLFPVLIVVMSLEGVVPELSFERESVAGGSKIVNLSIDEIKSNMQKPMDLRTTRPSLLNLFPMPTHISAESLSEGDVHEIYFDYYRWFFTNVHEGRMLLQLSEVGETHVRTRILEDTSYISNYIEFNGTLVSFEEISDDETKVTIEVYYTRSLDPAWYFAPLQKYAISLMAEHLISSIMERS